MAHRNASEYCDRSLVGAFDLMRVRLDYIRVHRLNFTSSWPKECPLQVFVRDNNVGGALRVLKMQREVVFREMKWRRFYEKPSEQATREKNEAVRQIPASRKNPGSAPNGKANPAERVRKY